MTIRSICVLFVISPALLVGVGCASGKARPQVGVRTAVPSPHTERLLKLAERYEQQGNYEGALRIYTQVAKADPAHSKARESIAALSAAKGRSPSEAERGIAAYRSRSTESSPASQSEPHGLPSATHLSELAATTTSNSPAASDDQSLPIVEPARSLEWAQLPPEYPVDHSALATTEAGEPQWWHGHSAADIDPRPEPVAAWSAATTAVETADWAAPGRDAVLLLSSSTADDRKAGLAELARCPHLAAETTDTVQRLADADDDPVVRAHAAYTLWTLTRQPGASVPVLTELLKSDDDNVVQMASYLLGAMGPEAIDACDDLRLACEVETGATRIHAAEALARIEALAQGPVNIMTAALSDADEEVRWLSAIALSGVGPQHRTAAVAALTAALMDQSDSVRSVAALTLGGFGGDARAAVPQLERAAALESAEVRAAAQTALACINR